MAQNRRNYYRLLQVQPDAVPEVIKAAYRALMGRYHPDVGGDHDAAALINEAYVVLSDAARRGAYDAQRAARSGRKTIRETLRPDPPAPPPPPPPAASARTSTAPPRPPANLPPVNCPMCQLLVPAPATSTDRCTRCRAPLANVIRSRSVQKTLERRSIPRVTKSDRAVLHLDWRSKPVDVRMRDLSLDGISLSSSISLPANQRVRIVSTAFDVVADIVTCRRTGTAYSLHAKLVTAIFATPAGGFVSARV